MRHISRILLLALLALPLAASAQTTQSQADLEAEASSLIAQIQALQGQMGTTGQSGLNGLTNTGAQTTGAPAATGVAGFCPKIGRTLKLGMSGDDVTRLQQFLAQDPQIYPEGLTTGYFGALTQKAVQAWQAKFQIVSSGTPDSTGYGIVGPRTAAAIAIVCSGQSYNGVSATISVPNVGGFLQVAPIAGNGPLLVQMQAVINTISSCDANQYMLDYGDGSNPEIIPLPANTCNQTSHNFIHTYRYGGVYNVTLSAGTHKTAATVTVYGTGAPGIPTSQQQTPAPQTPAASGQATVQMVSSTFSPKNISVAPGTTVVWTNTDSMQHTVTADNGSFDSGPIAPGASFALQFPAAGTYQYYCKYHGGPNGAGMSGVVTVGAGSNGTASNAALGPLAVTPNLSNRSVQAQFNLPGCPAYSISWGDGTAAVTQDAATCNSNGGGSTITTLNHTYTAPGNFTISLTRGSQVDTANVTFSN